MKTAAGFLTGVLLSASTFAQGTVAFSNLRSPDYRLLTYSGLVGEPGTVTNLMSRPGAYRIGLYAAPGAGVPEGSLQLIGIATNGSLPSLAAYFTGGNPFTLPGNYPPGQVLTFQLRAWSLSSGPTFESALVDPYGAWGVSPLGYTTPGDGTVPPGQLFGTAPGQLSMGFGVFDPVPEPSTCSLAILGGIVAAFVGLRRER
jgi:hypothetical protein